MIGRGLLFLLCFLVLVTGAFVEPAQAQPTTHPIWATTPDASVNDAARAQFEAATKRRGLGPMETVAMTHAPASRAAELLAEGITALRASNFVMAAALLGEAATQSLDNGGAGLSTKDFASLFFHQAMAIQLASGATYSEPFTEITPPDAKTAYLRAAVLGASNTIDEASSQPVVAASWRLAVATVAQRPSGALTVRAHSGAMVSVDGRAALPSPATVSFLPQGEHFVRVEEVGHAPWSTTVVLQGTVLAMDVPATQFLAFDTAAAVALAKSRGAAFALVGQLHLGDKVEIELRLVEARTGETRDATAVPVVAGVESPQLVAAVLRLDEMASRAELTQRAETHGAKPNDPLMVAAPPSRPTVESAPASVNRPGSWIAQRWPLVTAIAVAAGTAIVLGIVVAKDDRATMPARP